MRKFAIIIFAVISLILISIVYINIKSDDNVSVDTTKINTPEKDPEKQIVSSDDIINMRNTTYTFQGDLIDVTTGEIRGINTNKNATGYVRSNFNGAEYMMIASFENLPDPIDDNYYEGWLVRKDPFSYISTGVVEKIDGLYTDVYKSKTDYTEYNFYVLTLEPNDGNSTPADHILEGTMYSL